MRIANAKLADQLVDAWNSLDPQRVVDVLTEDHIYEDVTFAVVCRGAAETRGFFEGAYSAFPDIHFTLTSAATDAERAALEWTMTGTHQGDLPGCRPRASRSRSGAPRSLRSPLTRSAPCVTTGTWPPSCARSG